MHFTHTLRVSRFFLMGARHFSDHVSPDLSSLDISRCDREDLNRHSTRTPSHARASSSRLAGSPAAEEKKCGQGREWLRARTRMTYGAPAVATAAAAVVSEVEIYIANNRRPHLLGSSLPRPPKIG